MTPPRPAQQNGERLVFHQTPAEMAAAREQAALPPRQPQFARPVGPSPNGGETIEATGGHPFWVISGEDLDKRPVPEHCPAEVPNAAIPGRWVNAIDLRVGDILFTRDGRRVPVTNVSVRYAKMKVYNLQVAELENYAVGHAGILVHNTSGNQPPLKPLHSDSSLIQSKLDKYGKLSNQELIDSLKPGQQGALKVRPDGTMVDGHHRIKILRDRGVDVDSLPREIIPKDPIPGPP
jgi:hypothetical protein